METALPSSLRRLQLAAVAAVFGFVGGCTMPAVSVRARPTTSSRGSVPGLLVGAAVVQRASGSEVSDLLLRRQTARRQCDHLGCFDDAKRADTRSSEFQA